MVFPSLYLVCIIVNNLVHISVATAMEGAMTVITMIGLGEAGRLIGEGLARAGARVRGHDPFVTLPHTPVEQCAALEDALAGAEVVISLVGPAAAEAVAVKVLPLLPASAVYADLNTLSPGEKRAIGALAAEAGAPFADVAVMAPVPRAGSRTPLLAAGSGAEAFAKALSPLGTPVRAVSPDSGDAAARKLLRSVFMKGLAALIIESLDAASAAGAQDEIRDQIAAELGENGRDLVDRLVEGSREHAGRRVHEMEAAAAYLDELGVEHPVTEATLSHLRRLSA
jgi:3-hydroxyisobutyrate dehydrogenase-like beta-hydroxyacid dehydrogenase